MNLDKFEKIIRKIVREELELTMPKIIKEELRSISKTPITEKTEPIKAIPPVTGNGTLDQLLRETAASFDAASLTEDIGGDLPPVFSPPNDPTEFFMKDYSSLLDAIDSKQNFRP